MLFRSAYYVDVMLGRLVGGPLRRAADWIATTFDQGVVDGAVNGVARGRREVHVGGWEVAGIYLQRFVPWLLARIVRRMRFSVHDQGGGKP